MIDCFILSICITKQTKIKIQPWEFKTKHDQLSAKIFHLTKIQTRQQRNDHHYDDTARIP